MTLHRNQHDMGVFQTKVTFRLRGIQGALTFSVRFQRIVAIRMLIVGNRAVIPTAAHRQRIDDRNVAGTIAFRISGDIQHEEPMLETGVVSHIRLLFQTLEQSDLSRRPLVEQTGPSGKVTNVDACKAEDQVVADSGVLGCDAEGKAGLP